jgi:hypothetical protein
MVGFDRGGEGVELFVSRSLTHAEVRLVEQEPLGIAEHGQILATPMWMPAYVLEATLTRARVIHATTYADAMAAVVEQALKGAQE